MPERTPPTDQIARDSIRLHTGATLFVEAGAGTGKTHELVQRIVGLVANGTPLPQIAAITFTNAAAAELRDRVRLELQHAANGKTANFGEEERERCADAINAIDAATIQTLHSFAQAILAFYPIEAGLPPRLELRDDISAAIAFDERWVPFAEDLLKDGRGSPDVATALVRGMILGLSATNLRDAARRFHDEWDRVLPAVFEQPLMPTVNAGDAQAIIEGLQNALDLGHLIKTGKESDKAFQALTATAAAVREFREVASSLAAPDSGDDRLVAEEQFIRLLGFHGKLAIGRIGNKANWQGDSLDQVRDATAGAAAARDGLLSRLRHACLGPLLSELQNFVREYRDERVKQGTLEFHDLLILARDLLAGNSSVRQDLARRYRALLIDEFQDTDPIQIEIAVLIASDDPKAGDKPWDTVHVEPGRLFFVGDPKQSIYRFRRADIDLYRAAAARFGEAPVGETVLLTQSFRSVPSILACVNHLFAELFQAPRKQPEIEPVQQVEFVALNADRGGDPSSAVSVHLLGSPLPSDAGDMDAVRALEAARIAALIGNIKSKGATDGAWRVRDGKDAPWRVPRLQDIAILMPARTALPALEKALNEAGIPCRVESRSLLFETQEVRDLLTILAAIDDPTDQVAVVAALRSPGFGCSDERLYNFIAARGSWDYRRSVPEGYPDDDIVAQSMAALNDLNKHRWWLDTAEMVDLVIRRLRLFQLGFVSLRPRESWQRLRFVHEQARAFNRAGQRSLRQFVQYMERQAEEQARVTETAIAESDDDAVRIMTVHAAKGLEFPIVFLTGLNTKPPSENSLLLWTKARQPEVRIGSASAEYFETPGFADLRPYEEAMTRLERDRLLYVAATRARDHLVMSVFHKEPSGAASHQSRHATDSCTLAECVFSICSDRPDLWQVADPADSSPALPSPSQPSVADTPATRDTWQAERTALIANNTRMKVLSATAVARAMGAAFEPADAKDETDDEQAPWRRGRAGTSVGRAVHAVLQTINLATGAGLEATARAQAAAEGIPGREAEVTALAQSALQSAPVVEALSGGRYWREVYVSAPVADATLEGFIDLLYEGPDGLVVVDYKTDAVRTEAEIEATLGRYRLQGAAYALALQENLGKPVARCVFVFVREGHSAEVREIADLPAAIEEIRSKIPLLA